MVGSSILYKRSCFINNKPMIKEINLFAEHGVSEKQYLIWAWQRLSLKLMFKKWGIISSVAFSMALITLPFYLDLIKDHAFLSGFVKILLGVLFLLAVVGMHGWLFLYGYLGYLERKIKLQAEYSWDDSIHHGKAATVFGIGFMGLAIVSFGFFMIIPIGLLMGWK